MNIMGFGGSIHDLSACLLRDGKITCAIEEERITRRKHKIYEKGKFKGYAADYCLKAEGLGQDEIDLAVCTDIINLYYCSEYSDRLHIMNHHLSHAASAFFPSPFEEAAILVADGRGSCTNRKNRVRETVTGYVGQDDRIMELFKTTGQESSDYEYVANSLGVFYHIITECIGFGFMHDGKTMGLAPYGGDTYVKPMGRFYSYDKDAGFQQTKEQMNAMKLFAKKEMSRATSSEERKQTGANLASAIQYHLEQILVSICQDLYQKTGLKYLCLAGGVFLNSVVNYKILEGTSFEHIFIQPAAGDAGTAIGCSLYAWHTLLQNPRRVISKPYFPYLGREYTKSEMEDAVQRFKPFVSVERKNNIEHAAAKLLQNGSIIGWFQGRSEFGPRALGNRSILADARLSNMKDEINARIKHRESFRPFAPIILEEKQSDYYRLQHPSYHMLIVADTLKERAQEIPAVTHVDGTGRLQTVSPILNSRLHSLLTKFYEMTDTPVLLNTSFNDNEEPIVESPMDALSSFIKLNLDYLIMDDMVISKRESKVSD